MQNVKDYKKITPRNPDSLVHLIAARCHIPFLSKEVLNTVYLKK